MQPGIRSTAAVLAAVAALVLTSCSTSSEQPSTSSPATSSAAPTTTTPSPTPAPAPAASVATPLIGSVIAAPIPVASTDGKVHLAYELQLTNAVGQEVTLTSVAALADDKTLLTLSGDGLAYWTRVLGNPNPTRTIGPGQSALLWLDVTVDEPADVPANLSHAIGISLADPQPPLFPATMTETIAPTTVESRQPAVISPPLDGPNWLDGDGCCDMTAHRTALNPINGQLWGAERFAIDYVQLGPDGRLFVGDQSKVESYPYFGADIHAVANGPVVGVVDGLPEQVAGVNPTGLPLDQYGGNHIVQDIGDGNFAFYAHLQPQSLTVKPGDQLTTGQTIAKLGNSGNSDAPHLHFHVMSTPDPLRSNGLPFVLSTFRLDSRMASMDALDPLLDGQPAAMLPGFAARDETDASPLVLDVMTYSTG